MFDMAEFSTYPIWLTLNQVKGARDRLTLILKEAGHE